MPPGGGGDALPSSTADHNVNDVQATVTDVGAYGYYDPIANQNVGLGFRFMGFPSALFHGGLVLGTSPTHVSDAAYGSDDNGATRPFNFRSTATITSGGNPQITQYTCATFDDSDFDLNPLGVSTRQSTYAWLGDSYIIIEAKITATAPASGLFAGLYADWDIGTSGQNQVSYDFSRQLGIMSSLAGDPNFYGLQLLSHPASGFRAVDNAVYVYPSGPDPGFEDADKFQFFQGFGTVQSDRPADWSDMISAGPFNLLPGESVTVAFALLAGATPSSLLFQAGQAQSRWNAGIESPCTQVGECRYPPAGMDRFESTGQVTIDIPALGGPMTTNLSGPVMVSRSDPIPQGNLFRIDTEIREMHLTGISCLGPMTVDLAPSPPSLGQVLQNQPEACYPASSTFGVFVKIGVMGQIYHNNDPIHLQSTVHSLPPYEDSYLGAQPVTLFDEGNLAVGTIVQEIHTPQPPFDCMGSVATATVTLFNQPQEVVQLQGPVLVRRDAPLFNPGNNFWEVQTEMLGLDLRGVYSPIGPVVVGLHPDRPTLGLIQQPGFEVYPATSTFDVFFRMGSETNPDVCVENPTPVRMTATISGVPPIGANYEGDGPTTVVDWKPPHDPVGTVDTEVHTPTESFPWNPFPLPGTDYYCATCNLTLSLFGGGPSTVSNMQVFWAVERGEATVLPSGVARVPVTVQEFVASGHEPGLGGQVYVWRDTTQTSSGEVMQTQRGPTYPAQSSENLHLFVFLQGLLMRTSVPINISATIGSIPFNAPHTAQLGVDLITPEGEVFGSLHSMTVTPLIPFDGSCLGGGGDQAGVSPDCGVLPGTGVPDVYSVPRGLRLRPSVPNPFSSSASISFDLPAAGKVEVAIYNIWGRLVRTIDAGVLGSGTRSLAWDGRDNQGHASASGLYLYSVRTATGSASGRLLLLR